MGERSGRGRERMMRMMRVVKIAVMSSRPEKKDRSAPMSTVRMNSEVERM